MTDPDKARGLYSRWGVKRLNDPDGKHNDCPVLVMDPTHDVFARIALKAYAEACRAEYPKLADDVIALSSVE